MGLVALYLLLGLITIELLDFGLDGSGGTGFSDMASNSKPYIDWLALHQKTAEEEKPLLQHGLSKTAAHNGKQH